MKMTLTFTCCHCGGEFKQIVVKEDNRGGDRVVTAIKVDDSGDDRIVYDTTSCPHCGQRCRIELRASEVPTTQVYRGEAWEVKLVLGSADVAYLESQVFSTQPA